MRPYVKSIFSNLKSPKDGGEAWSLDLGQHTLLVGSNTSHKSSVIQSVELAIAGSADDIFGRSAVSDAALLLTLSPTDELGVTANLSNDKIKFNSSYNICRENGKVKRPNLDVPGAECLVHRSVMAALSGSSATARKAFLGWTGGTTDLADVLEHLPEDLHSKYTDIVKFKGRNKTAVEGLLEVTSYAGQRQREAAKEAKGAEIIMENLGDDVAARPTDEDMDKMRFAIAEAKEILDVSIRASGSGMTVEQRDEEIKKAKEKHNFFVNQKGLIEQAMNEMRASLPDKGENVDHAIKIVDVAVKHNLDVCPVCSSNVGLEHLKACQDFYKKQDADWSKQSENVISALSKMENDAQTYNQHLSEITFLLNKLETVELTQVDNRATSVNDAQARLEAAMAALSRMEQVRDEWDRLASAREKMISMKQDVDTYKRLKASCEVAVGKLLFARAEEFSARVQNYLPADWTFCIELLDGNKEVFRMGIKRDGRLHSALSGAEWTSVVTAISMSVAEGLAEGKPAILVPEDRAWDGKTLSSVMRGFSQFEGQVIMASTIRPTGRPPKGWTIIDMDEVSAEWCNGTVTDEGTEPVAQETEPIKKTSINHASGGFRVTTRSALILEESGFDSDLIQLMSRETVASIIKDGLAPENISVNDDGSYQIIRSAKVLPMPPAPKA